MHIAFLTVEYPPLPCGGIGTSIRNLASALVAHGHRVTIVGYGRNWRCEDADGIAVRFHEYPRVRWIGLVLSRLLMRQELCRMVRHEGLDVVEAHDWLGPSAGLRVPCPVVIRCHGSATYFAHILGEKVRWSTRVLETAALREADSIASVSRFTADVTKRLFGLNDTFRVIPNGIDLARFRAVSLEESEPDLVLYFGTVVRKKGVLDLCMAFSIVATRHPQSRLLVVGRDSADRLTGSPSTWALCEETLSEEARKRTTYVGPKPYDCIQEYVRKAAVCVFPSHAEALPLAWMEAMACAKPVVASNIGWATEMIEDGVSGILLHPADHEAWADAIIGILRDRDRAVALGTAARRVVEERFASEVVMEQSVKWYQEVIHGRRS
jgi:glycosyltransferase involved in cell wall biosynthesis